MDIYDLSDTQGTSIRKFLDLTLFSNPLGPSNKARHALRAGIKTVGRFPDPQARQLKRYIARKNGVGPEHIFFGHGSTQLLELLLFAVAREKNTLVLSPVSHRYEEILNRHHCGVLLCPSSAKGHFSPEYNLLSSGIGQADIILIQSPHHLTGAIVMPEDIQFIIDRAKDTDTRVVIDETFIEYAESESAVTHVLQYPNVIVVRTFSLFHALAGLRLGYAVGHPHLLESLRAIHDPGPPNCLAPAAALVSLKDKGYTKRTKEFLHVEKTYLKEKLNRIPTITTIDTPCNFLLIKTDLPGAELESRFLRQNILITCFDDADALSYICVPVRNHADNARFVRVLRWIVEGHTEHVQ
jgi:threonine-phosphate decarboxylase